MRNLHVRFHSSCSMLRLISAATFMCACIGILYSALWLYHLLCPFPACWCSFQQRRSHAARRSTSRKCEARGEGTHRRGVRLPLLERFTPPRLGFRKMYVSFDYFLHDFHAHSTLPVLTLKGAYRSGYFVLGATAVSTVALLFA